MRLSRPASCTLLAALAATWFLSACSTRLEVKDREPKSYHEVGAVHTAVISVVPFELIAGRLSPNFTLSGDDALAKALTVTRNSQVAMDRATQSMLSLALGDASAAPATAASAGGQSLPNATLPAATTASAPEVADVAGHNASLQYQLAASLHQEVQMLSSYVRDAPRRAGFSPFIVRIQAAVRPQARYTPFDAEVDLQFKCQLATGSGQCENPIVVPLLVTDSIDAGSTSSMQRNLAQLGLAVSAMKGKLGLLSSFGSRSEDIVSALGWQYDSVMNIAQKANGALSVRMNAMPSGYARFEMVPRVHNITVLLLVKDPPQGRNRSVCEAETGRDCQDIQMLSTSRFIHSRTAEIYDPKNEESSATTRFQVAFFGKAKAPSSRQAASLAVTGSKAPFKAALTVRGGANLANDSFVAARLILPAEKSTVPGSPQVVFADSVSVVHKSDRRNLVLAFSDLTDDLVKLMDQNELKLCLKAGDDFSSAPPHSDPAFCNSDEHPVTITGKSYFDTPPKREPKSNIRTSSELQVDPHGVAQLSLAVTYPDKLSPLPPLQMTLSEGLLGRPLVVREGANACAVIVLNKIVVKDRCSFDVEVRGLKVPLAGTTQPPVIVQAKEGVGSDSIEHPDKPVPLSALVQRPSKPAEK